MLDADDDEPCSKQVIDPFSLTITSRSRVGCCEEEASESYRRGSEGSGYRCIDNGYFDSNASLLFQIRLSPDGIVRTYASDRNDIE
jgi:hypothetical protein